jgi:uncharacterized membrane protein
MLNVVLYVRSGCHLCEQAKADLEALQEQFPHKLTIIDIESDESIKQMFALEIPVVEAGPFRLKAPFGRAELQATLGAATHRLAQLERINDTAYRASLARAQKITRSERVSFWISKHYLFLINLFLLLYVGLPVLGPVFKKVGWDVPARVIYLMYRPLCHQLAFRSWFLFGQQPFYPRAAAGIEGMITFEEATNITDENDPLHLQARFFEGNPWMGYKMALCQRDEAIWGSMLLFGLLYAISGRRIPKLHWMVWVLVGLVPIGVDGFSQLLSQSYQGLLHSILPYRESTPMLRTLTGFLFGWTTAWFMFPLIEETMAESRRILAKKFAVLKG